VRYVFILILPIIFSSCSLLTKKGDWGKHALWPIKSQRIKNAFIKNISSPHVWIPASAAAVTYLGHYDKKITSWAVKYKPVFNDRDKASEWSDDLLKVFSHEMYLTMLLTASSDEEPSLNEYVVNKGKGYLVIRGATLATDRVRDKSAGFFDRQKPNDRNQRSFPSGHSSKAASRVAIANRNLDYIPMHDNLRTSLQVLNTSAAGLMQIARIEARAHYPSDTLMGYALGTFISGFIYDSLMNLESDEFVSIVPYDKNITVQYTLSF
jgi:hypothetical protein